EPEIGAKITLPYVVGNGTDNSFSVTGEFTLCGWWEFDEAGQAAMAIVPRSYAEQVLSGYQSFGGDTTGTWDLNVYLKSSAHIEDDLEQVLENHGYQNTDEQAANYINTGVNWAYLGAQLSSRADPGTIAGMAVLVALIVLTGYLIIYNIFQISVSNDIRFYGLLKTIGTTGRQLRRIIRRQALTLCVIGIPAGLILGWLVGRALSPSVLSTLNTYKEAKASANPLIFLGAAAFSLVTVLISCAKPGRTAGRVSPVEAVRWTEGGTEKSAKKLRRARTVTPRSMALANLSRSKKRTILVVLSLSLAVVLLELTCTFANGFDMDKYLEKFVVSDYILGSAEYFQSANGAGELPAEDVRAVQEQAGITAGGCVYGGGGVQEFVSEQRYREHYGEWNDSETVDSLIQSAERNDEGDYENPVNLYGMEDYPLGKLTVLDGSLDALSDPAEHAVAAVLRTDDYGKPIEDTNWAKVGDKVTLRYVEEYAYYDAVTGELVDPAATENGVYERALKYHEVTYTVAAVVTMPSGMSYRFYGNDEFVLGSDEFQKETGVQNPMIYLFDVDEAHDAAMERFLNTYTSQINPNLDFESKGSYTGEFTGTRDMFLLVGGALSAVIGLVGVLNFLNAVLTSILSRRRELAILQSVGMTGAQLRKMLIWEGELYALMAAALSLALCFVAGPLMQNTVGGMLWFFTYRFTIVPVLIV
ncbi:MAG TPA: FtsX-like permease family protein, partial [Oscillospiraceae bacterium]|nr:FtsX-like permease family protein [Oscillospiraceae bacterium]